jgi:DNA-binding LacI/PurR family transcriptional regulator
LGGPLNRLVTQRRLEGYRQILQENGVSVCESWIQFGTDFYPVHGVDAARALFSSCSPGDYPDALFCASDGLAAGALRVCRELRLRVPEDLAIIGFDDSPMCLATDPPLSSIRMPVQEVGRACVRLLLDRIEAPHTNAPENLRLPCSLVVRESA